MKYLYIIILIYTINTEFCLAQTTVNLENLNWIDGIEETTPVREFKETDDGLVVTYYFNKINLYPDNLFDGAHTVHIDGFGNNMTEEEPLFPIRLDRYAINFLGNYSVTMLDSSYVEFPLELSPARSDYIESREKYEEKPVKPIRMTSGYYPCNSIEYAGIDLLKNLPTVYLKIMPVEYCHETKTVRCFTKVSFLITSDSKERVNVNKSNIKYINNFVENSISSIQDRSDSIIICRDFLIVTSNQLLPAAQLFAEWKKMQGFNVSIQSRDVWNATGVKSVTSSFYDTNHLQYILLFGDETNVPPSQFYLNYDSYPGDIDYLNFNGSYHDDEISMGRIPVSNLSEAQVVLSKIYEYERVPEQDSLFYGNVLASSYFQEGNIPGTASLNYVESTEEVRTYLMGFNKNVHRVYYTEQDVEPLFYSANNPVPDSLRKDNFNWDGDSADINNIINNGAFLVYHRDHGLEQRWVNPKYDTDDISNLINGSKLPVVFSIACLSGRYTFSEESFVERFMKKEIGGCVGMIAATGQTNTDACNSLLKGLIDVIWPSPGIFPNLRNNSATPVYMIGDILKCGISRANPYSSQNRNRSCFHCFSDPTLQLYTEKPIGFENVSITKQNNQIVVNTNGQAADISFYDTSTGDIHLYNATSVTESCNPDETYICISNPNKIPYINAPYQNLYIQNDTIAGLKTYDSDHIIIGSYVDMESPFGPVLFSGGNITINGDYVEIRGEVSIETGTELTIDTR